MTLVSGLSGSRIWSLKFSVCCWGMVKRRLEQEGKGSYRFEEGRRLFTGL